MNIENSDKEAQQLFIWSRPKLLFSDEIKRTIHDSLAHEKSFINTMTSLFSEKNLDEEIKRCVKNGIFNIKSKECIVNDMKDIITLKIDNQDLLDALHTMYQKFLSEDHKTLLAIKKELQKIIKKIGITHAQALRIQAKRYLSREDILSLKKPSKLLGENIPSKLNSQQIENLIIILGVPTLSEIQRKKYVLESIISYLYTHKLEKVNKIILNHGVSHHTKQELLRAFIYKHGLEYTLKALGYTSHDLRSGILKKSDLKYYLNITVTNAIDRKDIQKIDKIINFLDIVYPLFIKPVKGDIPMSAQKISPQKDEDIEAPKPFTPTQKRITTFNDDVLEGEYKQFGYNLEQRIQQLEQEGEGDKENSITLNTFTKGDLEELRNLGKINLEDSKKLRSILNGAFFVVAR